METPDDLQISIQTVAEFPPDSFAPLRAFTSADLLDMIALSCVKRAAEMRAAGEELPLTDVDVPIRITHTLRVRP